MRGSDLIPVVLLGGIAAFVAIQSMRRDGPPEATGATAETRVAPQGGPAGPSAAEPATESGPIVELRVSGEPAPERDDEAIRSQIRERSPGTYLPEILEDQRQLLMRWPERRYDAVRVWIERDSDTAGWDASYPLVAERAFEEWREAGFPLRFDIIPDSVTAAIKIRWVRQFPEGRQIGMTSKMRDQHGWIAAAKISIATHDGAGRRLPAATVAGVARHEVGHALGLGHSRDTGDVMYPESRTPIISVADRATLHLLYTLPPGIVK